MLQARIDTNVMGLTPGDVAITDTHTWIYRFALTGNLAAQKLRSQTDEHQPKSCFKLR